MKTGYFRVKTSGMRLFSSRLAVAAMAMSLSIAPSALLAQQDAASTAEAVFPALPLPPDTVETTARDLAAVPPAAQEAPAVPAAQVAQEALAVVEPRVAESDALNLPALPDVSLSADIAASETTTPPGLAAPSGLAQPSAIEKSPDIQTGAIPQGGIRLDLPALPTVAVSIEQPAPPPPAAMIVAAAPLRLDLDEAKARMLLETMRIKHRLKPAEIEAFVASYLARDFRPLWLEAKGEDVLVSARADAMAAVLAGAEQDGLDAQRLISVLPQRRKGAIAPEARAEIDLQFSLAAFLYARDARGGRIDPTRLSALLTPKLDIPLPSEVLDRLATVDAGGIEAALESYQPQHAGYRGLRKALAKLREELATPVLTGSVAGLEGAPHPSGAFPANWLEGPPLAFDRADPRVSLLRLRLGLSASASNLYDEELRSAVIQFQRANELTPNARITPKTRAALENLQTPLTLADRKPDRQALLGAMIANMERWRWLPSDLGKMHVFVNVPDFQLKVFADNAVVHQTRVIVGKPQTQTPVFSDRMEHLIVNPSWGVPASILKKEFLPKMATDPDYAARRGFQVVRNGKSISIRQPPGEKNALAFIKFIFPNQHAVYLHDTPSRGLFANDVRALSHGCVRVDKPFALAEKLLSTSLGMSEQQLRGMIGRGERMIKLTEKIPVHLTYFTVFVDEAGEIQQRRDIYGHDSRVKTALQL